jgi:hypothetical protein
MKLTKQHVVDVFRRAGLTELADEAQRDLPDEMEEEEAARWGVRHGVNLGELTSRMGGSP